MLYNNIAIFNDLTKNLYVLHLNIYYNNNSLSMIFRIVCLSMYYVKRIYINNCYIKL